MKANYRILKDTPEKLILQDLGPWDKFATITNAAEEVVAELAPRLKKRRLLYIDSEGQLDELIVERGKFKRFSPVRKL